MKKILLAGAALTVVMAGAVAVAQSGGDRAPRAEQAHYEHGGRHHGGRHWDEDRGHGRWGHHRGGRRMERMGRRMDALFDEADIDGDGVLSAEEIEGFRDNRFAAMDANGDGGVDARELVDFRLMQRAKRQIARLDENNDGVLSIDELPMRQPPFERFDLDGNGSVTKAEIELARDADRGRGGWRRGGWGDDDDRGPRRESDD